MCVNPNYAIMPNDGGQAVFSYKQLQKDNSVPFGCGKCHVCISKRSIEWGTRARHEISSHDESSFITLTYNDEHIRSDEIVYYDFQNFMYKIRKRYPGQVRYMVSCEYGENFHRPHFHAILFGLNPPGQKFIRTTPKGSKLYTSQLITDLWDKGYHSIGEANESTAYYIASYALSSSKHEIIRKDGEIIDVQDTMKTSNRPAIGYNFFKKNYPYILAESLFSNKPIPRYYLKKLQELDPDLYLEYKINAESNIKIRSIQNDYSKLITWISKNNMDARHDRSIKDFTFIRDQLKFKLQEINHASKDA